MHLAKRKCFKLNSEIDITPLVDVMLVLLIIFMVAAPMLSVGIPVDLPKTSTGKPFQEETPLVVTVNDQGHIFLEDHQVQEGDLVPKLKTIKNQDDRIYVRGDQKLSYGRIVEVMELIVSGGYSKVSLVTDLKKK